jgi:hypothetical protein
VGLIPLLAHYGIAAAAAVSDHPARCDDMLVRCHLISETPYGEISILAVVTAGVSAVAALGYGHHMRRSPPNWLTYLLLILSISACLVGIAMYVVAEIGVLKEGMGWATWVTLAAALLASLLLSLERAVR